MRRRAGPSRSSRFEGTGAWPGPTARRARPGAGGSSGRASAARQERDRRAPAGRSARARAAPASSRAQASGGARRDASRGDTNSRPRAPRRPRPPRRRRGHPRPPRSKAKEAWLRAELTHTAAAQDRRRRLTGQREGRVRDGGRRGARPASRGTQASRAVALGRHAPQVAAPGGEQVAPPAQPRPRVVVRSRGDEHAGARALSECPLRPAAPRRWRPPCLIGRGSPPGRRAGNIARQHPAVETASRTSTRSDRLGPRCPPPGPATPVIEIATCDSHARGPRLSSHGHLGRHRAVALDQSRVDAQEVARGLCGVGPHATREVGRRSGPLSQPSGHQPAVHDSATASERPSSSSIT